MTAEEIARIRALCDAATPGPWRETRDCGLVSDHPHVTRDVWSIPKSDGDMPFIAAARTALPAVLDEIERLREREIDLLSDGVARENDLSAAKAEIERLTKERDEARKENEKLGRILELAAEVATGLRAEYDQQKARAEKAEKEREEVWAALEADTHAPTIVGDVGAPEPKTSLVAVAKDRMYWRQRWSDEAKQNGEQAQRNWERAQRYEQALRKIARERDELRKQNEHHKAELAKLVLVTDYVICACGRAVPLRQVCLYCGGINERITIGATKEGGER